MTSIFTNTKNIQAHLVLIVNPLACADPGIFFRGIQARQPENSLDKRGSNCFTTEKTILF